MLSSYLWGMMWWDLDGENSESSETTELTVEQPEQLENPEE
jgi:hypothetical protein